MLISIEEVKEYLKVDYNDEDNFIQELITASEQYLKNATGKNFNSNNALAKLFCKVLISDWYDNRSFMEYNKVSSKIRHTIQSILIQLNYCESEINE